jgi:hypothetical protein
MVVTAIALYQSASMVGDRYGINNDLDFNRGIGLIILTPLLLAGWELPLVCLQFYLASRNLKVTLLRAVGWSLVLSGVALLAIPPVIFIYFFPFAFVLPELLIGILQWLLMRPLASKAGRWILLRPVAYLAGTILGTALLLGGESLGVLSTMSFIGITPANAMAMGAVGGLVKGIALVYFVKLPLVPLKSQVKGEGG